MSVAVVVLVLAICLGFMVLGLWAISALFPGDGASGRPSRPNGLADRAAAKGMTRSG